MSKTAEVLMLEARDLSYRVPQGPVFQHLNLSIGTGEILGLMGPSGCGKTSLIRILSGLVAATAAGGNRPNWSGQIRWGSGTRPFRTGTVFQDDRLLPWSNIALNLRLACQALPNLERQGLNQVIPNLLWRLGLTGPDMADILPQMPGALSGGMRHRVSIARALLFGRELQLWDEPFQGIDPSLRLDIASFVRGEFKQNCSSALITGHDAADMLVLCDRILIMDRQETTARPTVDSLVEFVPAMAESERQFGAGDFRAERQRLESILHARGVK